MIGTGDAGRPEHRRARALRAGGPRRRHPHAGPGWACCASSRSPTSRSSPGPRPVTVVHPAATLPAHPTALGRALLAFSPTRRRRDGDHARGLRPYTPHTVTSPDRFRRALAVTRLTRVAVTRWELEAGVCGVAMPVFGPGGDVVARHRAGRARPRPRPAAGDGAAGRSPRAASPASSPATRRQRRRAMAPARPLRWRCQARRPTTGRLSSRSGAPHRRCSRRPAPREAPFRPGTCADQVCT